LTRRSDFLDPTAATDGKARGFSSFSKNFSSARTVGAASREGERFRINVAFSKMRNAVERGEFANRRKKIKNANRRKTRFRRSRVLRSRRNASRRGDEKVAAFEETTPYFC